MPSPYEYYDENNNITMVSLSDRNNNEIIITRNHIDNNNNHIIDKASVNEVRVKNNMLLINHYKQNDHLPMMCVYFSSKDDATNAYCKLESLWYHEDNDQYNDYNKDYIENKEKNKNDILHVDEHVDEELENRIIRSVMQVAVATVFGYLVGKYC